VQIIYKGEFHKVVSFGLLWTQLVRDDGVHVSVRYLSRLQHVVTLRACYRLSLMSTGNRCQQLR
jgi:hypothetical protein